MKQHYALVPPPPPVAIPTPSGWWARIVRLYGSADPRSLGLLRIALGAVLFADVALKLPEVGAHLSNDGWLSNHFALFRPMSDYLFSVYFAFGSTNEVRVLMALHLVVCVLLLLGWRTKLMQVLALVLTTSLNSRNILIENGGSVVLNIVLAWTLWLPLGQRFSVDSVRASLAARKETSEVALNDRLDPARPLGPIVSLAVTGLLLQWAVIYLFNFVQKNGAPWRDGTAVHYFLQQDRLVTWFGAWLRGVLPLGGIKALTYGTLAIEAVLPLLLLAPWRSQQARLVALGLAVLLHGSIDCVLQLGSFSWAMMLGFIAFVPPSAWSWAREHVAARRVPVVVHFNPESGASLALCRLVKRLDALGLVTFRALDDKSPKKSAKTLAVSVGGEKTEGGFAGVLAIAGSLVFGKLGLRLLSPLLRRRAERRLRQMAEDPQALDEDFGVSHLPAQADERADEPSQAELSWARLAHGMREGAAALLLVICATQLLIENAIVPPNLKPHRRPEAFAAVIGYPRIFQGWSMFAPVPPLSDGRLVIDGKTKDGRRLDPLTGREPVFEVHPAGAPRQNLIWGYFHTRISEDRFKTYWGGVRDFLMRHHELTDSPRDELASFEAYFVSETFPPPGQPRPTPEKHKLFSSSAIPGDGPPAGAPPLPKSKVLKPRAQ